MAKSYVLQFGATTWTGLTPTFTVFKALPSGGNTTAPTITEIPTSSGLYQFSYEPAGPVAFVTDGGAALPAISRFIAGSLDPVQTVDERITEMGTTLVAIGNTLGIGSQFIGSTASSFGSTTADPNTVFGYLKRLVEFNEGNSIFTKSSGLWQIFARGNVVGASTQLTQKQITDSGSVVTKA